ncbi:hypothetical protein HMPREF1591_01485 [Escherichia coli 113303]|nr:hypothetical protein HMPREF1591_01485 [Escherichia coli 113303]
MILIQQNRLSRCVVSLWLIAHRETTSEARQCSIHKLSVN